MDSNKRKWIELSYSYTWWLFEVTHELDLELSYIEYKVNDIVYENPTPTTPGFAEAFKRELTWMNLQQ